MPMGPLTEVQEATMLLVTAKEDQISSLEAMLDQETKIDEELDC
jgi:hypothetical protein